MKYNWLLANFADKKLEEEFLEHERENTLKYMRPVVLIFGILFFLFIIPDYFLHPAAEVFRLFLIVRTVFLVLVVILFIMLGNKRFQRNIQDLISIYTLIVSFSYLLIYYHYEASSGASPFYVQSLAVIVLILVFFSLDSHWLHMVAISCFLGSGFLVATYYREEVIAASGFAAVAVYIFLALAISSVEAYRINIYKRKHFLDRMQLKQLSEIDALTNAYNRGKFDEELKHWIDLAKRYNYGFALIIIDIDNLKAINDLHGHMAGDRVLKEFSGLVQSCLRSSDIFARWGGDEFMILLPNAGLEQAIQMAERIRDQIAANSFSFGDQVASSFGLAVYEKDDNQDAIIQRADSRLYRAKKEGKNRIISD